MTYEIVDGEFKNWIIANIALKYTQTELVSFVKEKIKIFHNNIIKQVENKLKKSIPSDYKTQSVLEKHKRGIPNISVFNCNQCINSCDCKNIFCQKLFTEIKQSHSKLKPEWSNTDPSLWVDDYWEVGKCFLNNHKENKNILKIEETDCSGLLNIMIHLTPIAICLINVADPQIGRELLLECQHTRNAIMHNPKCQIGDAVMKRYLSGIKDVLNCIPNLSPGCKKYIEELKTKKDVVITESTIQSIFSETMNAQLASAIESIEKSTKESNSNIRTKTTLAIDSIEETRKESTDNIKQKTTLALELIEKNTKKARIT